MEPVTKYFDGKDGLIRDGFKYSFDVPENGIYLIEIIASAKSWWQNLKELRNFFKDDDLAVKLDGYDFPKKNGKRGLFDGEAAWNGNNLKGMAKTGVFIADLSAGGHSLVFLADQHPVLRSISVRRIEGGDTDYVPEGNNPPEDGDRRQWVSIILVNLPLESLSICARANYFSGDRDGDDLKLVINGEIQKNENRTDFKNWYWCGMELRGQEKEFSGDLNLKKGSHYIELWADRMPELKNISLTFSRDISSDNKEYRKRIPSSSDPKWTGDFNDDTEQIILARAIFGEARSLSENGRIAVGWTIKNRVGDPRWANTYKNVILAPAHFSAFNEGDPNLPYVRNPFMGGTQINVWYECYEIAGKIMTGEIKDPTGGANHYFSDFIDYPAWTKSKNAEFRIKIGNTLFYNLRRPGSDGFAKVAGIILVSISGVLLVLGFVSVLSGRYCYKETSSGLTEAEQYRHFFINQKTNEVQAAYFSARGNFLRVGTITRDGYPKSQLNIFSDGNSEIIGYLQVFYDQKSDVRGNNGMILMIKGNEYDEPKEVYRSNEMISKWNWLDRKHADIFFNCGTGCQHYHRINIDTKELEDEGTIFLESV